MILRASKFFGFCYADEHPEKEFFAKNFNVALKDDIAEFSFEFMRGLDLIDIKRNVNEYQFFEFEDRYLANRITKFLEENSHVKIIKFTVNGQKALTVKQLKITIKGFSIKLV